jgi:ketosteroid isomerase-like protein
MREILFCVTLAIVLAVGCQQAIDIEAEKTAVKAVLADYITSVEKEDLENYGKNVDHDPEMMNFGAFGDPIVGWEALEKLMEGQYQALSESKITTSDVSIQIGPSGQLAWATSLWSFQAMMGENPVEWPVRCSWILEKREGRWVIIHFHKSLAAG